MNYPLERDGLKKNDKNSPTIPPNVLYAEKETIYSAKQCIQIVKNKNSFF